MSSFAAAGAAALVVAWAALVIVAQSLNPEQSPLTMGMSGLARGRTPWVMKTAFLCRGASALLLLISLPAVIGTAGLALAGFLALWVWGVGSAALAVVDTDMPGEPPSQTGAVHTTVALLAYVCGVAGAAVLSVVLMRTDATAGVGVLALLLALLAAAAMVLQFVAFSAAAVSAAAAVPTAAATVSPGAAAAIPAAAAPAPPQLGVPSQLAAPSRPATARPAAVVPPAQALGVPLGPPSRRPGLGSGRAAFSREDLGRYAGLLQRVFTGLLMVWTLLVAVGVVRL